MNSEFIKDVSKAVKNADIGQELSPGSTGRRYEPTEGENNLKRRIHRESKYIDTYGNLPYSFRKPPKAIGSRAVIACDNCGNMTYATTATAGIICRNCGQFSSVTVVPHE